MRDYAKIAPQFWTGRTGKILRAAGRDAQVVALYLVSCPSSSMTGLYYIPISTIAHETGCSIEETSKALARLSEAHFCLYDNDSEHVFVTEMAKYQIGERLKESDKRVKWIHKHLRTFINSPFFLNFIDRYLEDFHLEILKALPRSSEAPPKPVAVAVAVAVAGAVAGAVDKRSSSKVRGTSDASLRLSRALLEKIRKNNPAFKEPNLDTWAKQFDQMMRLDHLTEDMVLDMITFAQSDPFWHRNILSPKTLRLKWDRLTIERNHKMGHQPEKTGAIGLPVTQLGNVGQETAAAAARVYEKISREEAGS